MVYSQRGGVGPDGPINGQACNRSPSGLTYQRPEDNRNDPIGGAVVHQSLLRRSRPVLVHTVVIGAGDGVLHWLIFCETKDFVCAYACELSIRAAADLL